MPNEYQFVDFLFGGMMTLQGDGDPHFVEPRTYRAAYEETADGVFLLAVHRRGANCWVPDQLPAVVEVQLCELIQRDIAQRRAAAASPAPAIEGDALAQSLKRLADR